MCVCTHVCTCICSLPEEKGGKFLLGMMCLNSNPRHGRYLGKERVTGAANVSLSDHGDMESISSWTQRGQ